jgi:hypothetical protein
MNVTKMILQSDPLAIAEKITGEPGSAKTEALGVQLMMDKVSLVREHMGALGDTHHMSTHEEFEGIVKKAGFELILDHPFDDGKEHLRVFFRRGIILKVESYGEEVNSADVYFNLATPSLQTEEGMELYRNRPDISGGFLLDEQGDPFINEEGKNILPGSIDVRTGLLYNLKEIEEHTLEVWVKAPFMWLVNYRESEGEYDCGVINRHRISQFTDTTVRDMVQKSMR